MPRPKRKRLIGKMPCADYFKPAGIPVRELEEIVLAVDEFEAIRLKDYKELSQEEAAKRMGISQPTFHRLVSSARNKLSNAIINGKAIKIKS